METENPRGFVASPQPEVTLELFLPALQRIMEIDPLYGCLSSKELKGGTRNVYLGSIKQELYPADIDRRSVIVRELDMALGNLLESLSEIHNPHIEKILSVIFSPVSPGHAIAVSAFIPKPKCLACPPALAQERTLSLAGYIRHFGLLNESDAFAFSRQLAMALMDLKRIRVTHGDIAPQNLLLTDAPVTVTGDFLRGDGISSRINLVLIDFGASRLHRPVSHRVTEIQTTSLYGAPDHLDHRIPTDRMDIYSLGCVLHFMLTGHSPKETGEKVSISRRAKKIVDRCTAEYGKRYPDPEALLEDLLRQSHFRFRFLSWLPGFRSGVPWKMLLATTVYIYFLLSLALAFIFDPNKNEPVIFAGMFLSELIVLFDLFHLEKLLPEALRKTRSRTVLRWVLRAILFILVFWLWTLII